MSQPLTQQREADERAVIERAIRFIESGSHSLIARDTMTNELRKVLSARAALAQSEAPAPAFGVAPVGIMDGLIASMVDRDTPPDNRDEVIDYDIRGNPITRGDVGRFVRTQQAASEAPASEQHDFKEHGGVGCALVECTRCGLSAEDAFDVPCNPTATTASDCKDCKGSRWVGLHPCHCSAITASESGECKTCLGSQSVSDPKGWQFERIPCPDCTRDPAQQMERMQPSREIAPLDKLIDDLPRYRTTRQGTLNQSPTDDGVLVFVSDLRAALARAQLPPPAKGPSAC